MSDLGTQPMHAVPLPGEHPVIRRDIKRSYIVYKSVPLFQLFSLTGVAWDRMLRGISQKALLGNSTPRGTQNRLKVAFFTVYISCIKMKHTKHLNALNVQCLKHLLCVSLVGHWFRQIRLFDPDEFFRVGIRNPEFRWKP